MQGFNMGRYVPPEYEGVVSANKLAGKNALGSRARKASSGILTVRFEMPFPIWCNTCTKPTIIGQGVRFNAEKKKVDAYYSTPIFSFRMKHNVCGGWIEIRTDPKNTAYVVTEGARKKDTGEDTVRDDEEEVITAEERERRKEDAFAALEGKSVDSRRAKAQATRIQELQMASERDWGDTYSLNRRLRKSFRIERKIREREAGIAEGIQDKFSLGIDLVPATDEDKQLAGLIEFGDTDSSRVDDEVVRKPMFEQSKATGPKIREASRKKLNAAGQAQAKKVALQKRLQANTRLRDDPFINHDLPTETEIKVPPLKRAKAKDSTSSTKSLPSKQVLVQQTPDKPPLALVDYDSDSS